MTKLAFLAVATAFAALAARRLEPGNPARLPWTLLALGIGVFLAGQSILGVYQLVLHVPSPFPSAADVLFVGAYPLLFAALLAFVRAYREAGYPVGSPGEHALTAVVGAALFAAPTWALLRPILAAPTTPLERALNAAYPLLDVVVLLPIRRDLRPFVLLPRPQRPWPVPPADGLTPGTRPCSPLPLPPPSRWRTDHSPAPLPFDGRRYTAFVMGLVAVG